MSKNLNTTMKKLFYLLLALAVVSCGEPTPSGPDWGNIQKPEPEQPKPEPEPEPEPNPDQPKPEIVIRNIEPTTALGAENENIEGLRFYPGISINIATSNFDTQLASIANAGFKYIEITIKDSFGARDMTDDQVKATFTARMNAVKAAGLTVWSIHLPYEDATWTNIAGKESVRVQSVNNIMRVLRLCTECFPECKNYVLHASKGVLSPRSESVNQARKSLTEMVPVATQLGVRLCVENLVGSLCYYYEELHNTIVGIDNTWVTYDIGHANCKGYDVVEFLSQIGTKLGTVHMHDTKFGSGNDSHSLLGDASLAPGNIKQWDDVIHTLLETNRYRGVFMFELSGKNPNTVMESYNRIVSEYAAKYENK